jgi:predicted O-methyltransferase YrrM
MNESNNEFWRKEITQEAAALLPLIPKHGEAYGAEIGALRAKSACILLHRRPHLRMVLVDSWDDSNETMQVIHQTGEETYQQAVANTEPFRDRVHIIRATSVEGASKLPDESLDFAHIDADHYYESVIADCHAWWPKVKPGGFLCGHDIDHPLFPQWGVREAAEEFSLLVCEPLKVDKDLWHWRIRKPL